MLMFSGKHVCTIVLQKTDDLENFSRKIPPPPRQLSFLGFRYSVFVLS